MLPIPLPLAAVLCLMTALVLSLLGTPIAARTAVKFGIVDRPDGTLKKHHAPVPYLGGLAVYGSFVLTMALAFDFSQKILGLLLAGTILVLLGLIDDFGVLGVWPKFIGQGFATVILIKSDIAIHIGVLPDWLNMSLTVLWILGVTNAFNIIDIMDGLASGAAFIAAAFLLVVAFLNQQGPIVLMTATLMGSLLGFLRFNVHPARIFMGDTGSLFIGMMLGALAMIGKYDARNDIGYLSPLLILAIPIFDTLYVMTLRLLRASNPFKGSPDHFALRMRRLGLSVPWVVGLTWAGGALMGGLAIINLYLNETASALLVISSGAALALFGLALGRVRLDAPAQRPAETPPSLEEEARYQQVEVASVAESRRRLAEWRRR